MEKANGLAKQEAEQLRQNLQGSEARVGDLEMQLKERDNALKGLQVHSIALNGVIRLLHTIQRSCIGIVNDHQVACASGSATAFTKWTQMAETHDVNGCLQAKVDMLEKEVLNLKPEVADSLSAAAQQPQ
eukprot:scaffold128118_cov18-Prasinocladus_malaysianus.AAC.1